ncbi:hypothetical protein ACH5RR_017323 [Cinchona calisaya]|uniref:Pentatricopeptide repeat-containing protein n=1 Tax=Cinchona calisaya TaxID=153742 RepID=A0ABD2ZYF6_9GENT
MSLFCRYSCTFSRPLSSASILSLLRRCKTIRSLEQVHPHIIHKGCEQDAFLITEFISLCIAFSSNLSYPTSLFERITQPNIYLWNTLVKGYCRHSSLTNSFWVFSRMKVALDVTPDKYTFPPLIKNCANSLALREGRVLHGLILRCGTDCDVFVGSSLIDFYGKCKEIQCARQVFDGMPVRNEVSWTAMIVGYLNYGDPAEAKNLFDGMAKRNVASWNAMISGFVKLGNLKSARHLFDEMPERNAVSYTTMIDGYAKAGDMESARMLFEQLVEKDIISWSALISGYAQNGQPTEAIQMFYRMQFSSVKPDEFIMVSLMSACSQLGCLELAKTIDSNMHGSSFDLRRVHIAAALVDMNAKCGNMDRASTLFEEMPTRDIVSYCSMMQGLSIHGRGLQAVALFDRMLKEGLVPDSIAFTVILTACSHAGLVEEGCRYFDSMVNEYSLEPSPEHYACLVDLLGRSGKLKTAYELLNSMPVKPHAGAWGALLGACKLHCDLELGEEVARRLIELEPLNACNYVLLSDIYAAANKWLDVSLMRLQIRERGLRKVPGRSWV